MKSIEAVVNQAKLHEVRYALNEVGIEEFTESTIICHGHQKSRTMSFRGAKFIADVVEKVKLEIIAADDAVEKITEALRTIASSGSREECRIAIRPYLEVT